MKVNQSVESIILWLRAAQMNLENLEESPLWRSLTASITGDYVATTYNEHIGNCVALVNDLANRFQELKQRLEVESQTMNTHNYISSLSNLDIAGFAVCCCYAIRESTSLKVAVAEMGFGLDPDKITDVASNEDLINLSQYCLSQLTKKLQNND